MAAKLDLQRAHRSDYAAPREPTLLTIAPARYLAITGRGAPASPAFVDAIGALYGVAFTIKMRSKRAGRDYGVAHLEGLWWSSAPSRGVFASAPSRLCWQLLIRTPDFVAARDLRTAQQELLGRGRTPLVLDVKLVRLGEGRCVQMLHVGPYASEPATFAAMEGLASANGLAFRGPHHEIYLSDPRRVAPERLRTILRQPVARAAVRGATAHD